MLKFSCAENDFCSIKKKYIIFSLWNLCIKKYLCIFALSLKQRDMEKKQNATGCKAYPVKIVI